MCLGRRTPVLAPPQAATACDWLVLGDPPDELEERAGRPFVEEAGQLLDNMLRAVGVQRWDREPNAGSPARSSRAYLTHVLKCRPALMRAPDAAELGTCAHFLRREIALTQPKVIIAMGRFAMQLLLSETPPAQARLPLGQIARPGLALCRCAGGGDLSAGVSAAQRPGQSQGLGRPVPGPRGGHGQPGHPVKSGHVDRQNPIARSPA